MSNPSITADKTPWYQWDTGLTVTVSGGEMTECHFANRKQGTAYVQAVINGVARVPDELLQVSAPVKAYGYVSDGAGGQTYIEETFDVIARNIPSDYTYTKTAQKTIRDAEAARDEAVQAAKDAKASELAADDSAIEASNSAQSAGESASAAATSASNAAKSAGDAAKSASDAKAAASKTVEDASELLKTYTDNAKTSADNAATSASNAADAASAASGSASAAAQSATDASDAKVAAQTAKAEAATSASNAATSASNAASSATAAAQSASDAAASVNAINIITPKNTSIPPSQENGIAVGEGAVSKGTWSVAIGKYAIANGAGAAALVSQAHATNNFSTAAVNGATTSREREFSVGTPEHTSYLANVTTPSFGSDAATKKYTDDNDAKMLSEAKKYTDDNDAKTLSEAKKYTDANTSNALVGTVSGKLLHVEDAWPSPVREFVVYGKSVQDGTPAPDAPVPIESVSELSVVSTGKNMLLVDEKHVSKPEGYPSGWESSLYGNGWLIPKDKDIFIGGWGGAWSELKKGDYVFSCNVSHVDAKNYIITVPLISNGKYVNLLSNKSLQMSGGRVSIALTVPDDGIVGFRVTRSDGSASPIYITDPQLEQGSTATDYSPYVGSTKPNLLVSEDGTAYELRSLPDGTMDELLVKDGRKVLRQRIIEKTFTYFDDVAIPTDTRHYYEPVLYNIGTVHGLYVTSALPLTNRAMYGYDAATSENCFIVSRDMKSIYWRIPMLIADNLGITTKSALNTWLVDNPLKAYLELVNPIDIDLGPADPIALPENISNVWTDAELTTDMSMTYKRDINIAFDNLVQAVVAAAAGE